MRRTNGIKRRIFATTVSAGVSLAGSTALAIDLFSWATGAAPHAAQSQPAERAGSASASGPFSSGVEQASWNSPANPGIGSLAKPSVTSHASTNNTRQGTSSGPGLPFKLPAELFSRPKRPMPTALNGSAGRANRASTITSGGTSQHTPLLGGLAANPERRPSAPTRVAVNPNVIAPSYVDASRQESISLPVTQVIPATPASSSAPESIADGPILSAANEATPVANSPPREMFSGSAAARVLVSAYQMAEQAEREADFSEIIETCRRARASQPEPIVARYANELAAWSMNRRGQLKAEAGQLNEAMLDFDEAVRLDEKCWRALHNRGVLYAQSGEFEKAFDDFGRTIAINPNYAKAYANRGALYVVAGEVYPALDDYTRAIELDADLAVAHRGRGRVCHLLGRLDEAIENYDAAVQISPRDAYAIASRADLLTDLGRYTDASREYERAIEIDESLAHAYRGAAWLLATCPDESVRNASLALERAQAAIRLEGKEDSLSYDTLAAAQANGGDFAAATETLNQAIAIAPENEQDIYRERLSMYGNGQAFRIAPVRPLATVGFRELE